LMGWFRQGPDVSIWPSGCSTSTWTATAPLS
jgi:hypothetical protein